MAASSSSASLFGIREGDQNPMNPQHSSATTPASSATAAAPPPPQKKKRNQPGTPSKEQNLQLHRRGHNLPWKLKQKTTKEPKRKVYLCPEPTCVHHDPSRALGDLTGIKKHYSRKHGEKKWKCEKCSKKYAVQSDWKAHSKTCGTREYRCDCGTLFSRCVQYCVLLQVARRDSFITHRAFCDALAQESARQPSNLISSTIGSQLYGSSNNNNVGLGLSHQVGPQISSLHHHHDHPAEILRLGGAAAARAGQFDHLLPASFRQSHHNSDMGMSIPSPAAAFFINPESSNPQNYQRNSQNSSDLHHKANFQAQLMQFADGGANNNNNSPTSGAANNNSNNLFNIPPFLSGNNFSEQLNASVNAAANANEGGSNNFFSDMQAGISSTSNSAPSLFSGGNNNAVTVPPLPHMSATALLQKAAQMGAASSSNNSSTASLLRSFGSSSSSSGTKADHHHHHHHHLYGGTTTTTAAAAATATNNNHNNNNIFGRNDDHNNNNLHDLMNSFTAAVGGGGGFHEGSYDHSNPNRDLKLPVGCDRLTRDFLGVGQIVRSMSGGINSPRDHHQHHQHGFINLASLETQRNNNNNNNNAAASGQSFGGDGGNFQ
ncbi:protein indeterminate-domain 5, chloroplastic [Senna tora]|uniref:Protein indeterminate-domain 5, chloroplastic n=1 Tax=Senna tora TaxID=362788 RepID=A0A834TSB2_9FABA|nr:protein indeterminate-domain 5, chloroplastic [Senna tora]